MPQLSTSSWALIASLLAVSSSTYLCKWLLQATVGWSLQRRTRARRTLILARVKVEESQYQLSTRQSPKSDDGEWEKVEKSTADPTRNGEEANDEWEGIIGFFHPFWFVQPEHGELDLS